MIQIQQAGEKPKRTAPRTLLEKSEAQKITLSFYPNPPTSTVNLEEFFQLAMNRLDFLKRVDSWRAQKISLKDLDERIKNLEIEPQFLCFCDPITDTNSHYILALAYSRTQEYRNFLLTNELAWFSSKIRRAHLPQVKEFLGRSGIQFPHPEEEHFRLVEEALRQQAIVRFYQQAERLSAPPDKSPLHREQYFCVPWMQCPELVSKRRCFLWYGSVYVPQEDLPALVAPIFRTILSRRLAQSQRMLPTLEASDERLARLLGSITHQHLGSEFRSSIALKGVSAASIDRHAREGFPPCMRRMFSKLRENHHLKHSGRMQLGLYLKGIGLSLEDSIQLWREELVRVVGDKFDKEYAYNIRHNYGAEGKRVNYSPYSCAKIIPTLPGSGEYHGCPFRYMNRSELSEFLKAVNLSDPQIANVCEPLFRKDEPKHYHLACRAFWRILHNNEEPPTDEPITHPNQFFELSYRHRYLQNPDAPPQGNQASSSGSAPPPPNQAPYVQGSGGGVLRLK